MKAQSAGVTIRSAFIKVGAAIKGAFISMLPTAIFVGILELVSYFRQAATEAKRIKNIFSDYRAEAEKSGNTTEVVKLRELLSIMNDRKGTQIDINNAQSNLESMLGVEKKSQEDINKLVAERIKLLESAAKADFYATKKIEYEDKNKSILNKASGIGISNGNFDRLVKLSPLASSTDQNQEYFRKALDKMLPADSWTSLGNVKELIDEYIQNQEVINDASSNMKDALLASTKKTQSYAPDDDKKKKTELQKSEDKYNESLRELQAQLELNKQSGGKLGISQSEYNKALDELNIKTLVDAKGTGDKELLTSKYLSNLQDAVNHPIYNQAQGELEAVQKKYAEQLAELTSQYKNGAINDKDYKSGLKKLADETISAAGSIKDVGVAGQSFIAGLKFSSTMLTEKQVTPTARTRDTTYDYKKSTVDITGEKLDIATEYANRLKDQLQGQIGDLMDELDTALENKDFAKALKIAEAKVELKGLAEAIKKMDGLDKALALATVKKDIKDLNKELWEGTYSGIKDIASSSDRVVSAFSNLKDVFNDVDSSGWEKIMAIWNAMATTLDSFLSIIDMINNITEVTEKLADAKTKEAEIDKAITAEKTVNAETQAQAEVIAIGEKAAAKVAASVAVTAAATTEMAAESTAAYAYIPFLGVELATAQITAMQGLIAASAIPAFSTGGIRQNTGDKLLTRVNPGEMILNDGQQSRLFQMLDSGNGSGGKQIASSITTKVRGKELILTINNELKSQGKKTIG